MMPWPVLSKAVVASLGLGGSYIVDALIVTQLGF